MAPAIDDYEYKLALTLLNSLPQDYMDVAQLRQQVQYRLALACLRRGEWQDAITALETLGDYEDCA